MLVCQYSINNDDIIFLHLYFDKIYLYLLILFRWILGLELGKTESTLSMSFFNIKYTELVNQLVNQLVNIVYQANKRIHPSYREDYDKLLSQTSDWCQALMKKVHQIFPDYLIVY